MGTGKFLYATLECAEKDEFLVIVLRQAPLELGRDRDLVAVTSTIDVEQFAGADEARFTSSLVCH